MEQINSAEDLMRKINELVDKCNILAEILEDMINAGEKQQNQILAVIAMLITKNIITQEEYNHAVELIENKVGEKNEETK